LVSLYRQLGEGGLDELMRLEACDPVHEAIRAGIIEEDDDAMADYEQAIEDVPAFSVNG
jgi:hypothetical protein